MTNDANDFLMSGGVQAATFKRVGDWVEGIIAQQPQVRQQRDPATKQLKTWPDGSPAMQIHVVLQTEQRDDPEDDGLRAIYIRGDMQRAVREAVRSAGADGLLVGGKLRVKHTALGEAKGGLNPPKLYEAKYRPPSAPPVPVPESPADLAPPPEDEVPF